MAGHTGIDVPSSSEADEHKLGHTTPITDSFENPSCSSFDIALGTGSVVACYSDGTDFAVRGTPAEDNTGSPRQEIHRNLVSCPPRSASRSSTTYAESLSSDSLFSLCQRTESNSSNGSHSADSNTSSPRINGPVAIYSTPVESLPTPIEPKYIEEDQFRINSSLSTSAARPSGLVIDDSFLIEFSGRDSSRSPMDPSKSLGQSPPKYPFAATLTRRHRTFPLSGTPLSSKEPTVVAFSDEASPAGTILAQNHSCLVPGSSVSTASSDGVTDWMRNMSFTAEPADCHPSWWSGQREVEIPAFEGRVSPRYPYPTHIEVGNKLQDTVVLRVPQLATYHTTETSDTVTDRLFHTAQEHDKHGNNDPESHRERFLGSSRAGSVKNE